MTTEFRAARADEMDQFGLLGAYSYGGAYGDGPDNVVSRNNRPEWTLCAFVDGRMAASYAVVPFTMRANGRAVALGGVTAVGTLPEYRRQGLVRAITQRSFAQMRERGQAVAALWASQAAIYQRYGYAVASELVSYRIDSVDIAFAERVADDVTVARLDGEAAYEAIKRLYIAFVADRIGYLHRAKPLWLNNTLSSNATTGPAHVAVATNARGDDVGYVVYHLRDGKTGHPSRGQEITIKDFVWRDAHAYRALWNFIARHDLVGRVVWPRAPVDDPAPELFVEPRLLNRQTRDGFWMRLVDAPRALAERGYSTAGSIVLEIAPDELAPWNGGRFELECTPDGATVTATRERAQLTLSAKALASLYSGFRTPRQLAQWGMLEADAAAIERATAIFATHHAPHCPDHF